MGTIQECILLDLDAVGDELPRISQNTGERFFSRGETELMNRYLSDYSTLKRKFSDCETNWTAEAEMGRVACKHLNTMIAVHDSKKEALDTQIARLDNEISDIKRKISVKESFADCGKKEKSSKGSFAFDVLLIFVTEALTFCFSWKDLRYSYSTGDLWIRAGIVAAIGCMVVYQHIMYIQSKSIVAKRNYLFTQILAVLSSMSVFIMSCWGAVSDEASSAISYSLSELTMVDVVENKVFFERLLALWQSHPGFIAFFISIGLAIMTGYVVFFGNKSEKQKPKSDEKDTSIGAGLKMKLTAKLVEKTHKEEERDALETGYQADVKSVKNTLGNLKKNLDKFTKELDRIRIEKDKLLATVVKEISQFHSEFTVAYCQYQNQATLQLPETKKEDVEKYFENC